jgi:hypothetical protein
VMMLEQTSDWNSIQRCIEAVNAAAWFIVENRCLLARKPALVGSGRPFSCQSGTPRLPPEGGQPNVRHTQIQH